MTPHLPMVINTVCLNYTGIKIQAKMHKESNYIFQIIKRTHNILLLFESIANMQEKNYWLTMNGFPT